MQKIINEAIEWLKNSSTEEKKVKGCITGSSLLGYFDDDYHQDIDVFIYDKKSFINLLDKMYYDDMFQLLNPLEKWKFMKEFNEENYKQQWLTTIKFTYNTCIPINIIFKKDKNNIFAVLSSFDMDIVAKGYDIQTKQWLDLTGNSTITKIADWNKWNTQYYSSELWEKNKILRQFVRIIKYYKRGYNTDKIVQKYLEILDEILNYNNIFNSSDFKEQLELNKSNAQTLKLIFSTWLQNHEITQEELIKLNNILK